MKSPRASAVGRIASVIVATVVVLAVVAWALGALKSATQDRKHAADARFSEASWKLESDLRISRIPNTDMQCGVGELKIIMASSGCGGRTAALVLASKHGKVYLDGAGVGGHFVDGRFRDRYEAELDDAAVLRLRKAAMTWVLAGGNRSEFDCGMPCSWGGSMVCVDGIRRAVHVAGFGVDADDGSDTFYGLLSARRGRDPEAGEGICI